MGHIIAGKLAANESSTSRLRRSVPHDRESNGQAGPCDNQIFVSWNGKHRRNPHVHGLTGHPPAVQCPLSTPHNAHRAQCLYRFHLSPSPDCDHCLFPETVAHFLLACSRYRQQRITLILRLGSANLPLHRLNTSKSDLAPVLSYVRDTGRLPRYTL